MRYFSLLLLIILSPLALADSSGSTTNTITFTPPASDMSVQFLGQIFGNVPGILQGSGSALVGQLLGMVNSAVLFLGGIIITYTVIVSTLNTAHEGQFMGQKWHSIWIPFRSAMGIAMMLPMSTGFAIVQAFIMWTVLQGVGAADSIWSTALNYIVNQGETAAPMPYIPNQKPAQALFSEQVCMYGANSSFGYNVQSTGVQSTTLNGKPVYAVQFIDKNNNFDCGYVAIDQITGNSDDAQTINDATKSALSQMVDITSKPAQQLVQYQNLDDVYPSAIQDAMNAYQATVGAAMRQVIASQEANKSSNQGFIEDMNNAKKVGWIYAGRYYYDMAQENNTITTALETGAQCASGAKSGDDCTQTSWNGQWPSFQYPDGTIDESGLTSDQQQLMANYGSLTLTYLKNGTIYNENPNVTKTVNSDGSVTYSSNPTYSNPVDSYNNDGSVKTIQGGNYDFHNYVRFILYITESSVQDAMGDLQTAFQQMQAGHDPVITLQSYGNSVLGIISSAWTDGLAIIDSFAAGSAVTGVAAGFVNMIPVVGRFTSRGTSTFLQSLSIVISSIGVALTWSLPITIAIFGMLFVTGVTLGIYIPMLPFILFTFGALGWMIAVVEAMIAGPLISLGVMHPEGNHQAFGKAEPAVMLLANIFLRPSLMVVGMIIGMTLSYVAISFVNMGFTGAVTSAIAPVTTAASSDNHWYNLGGLLSNGMSSNFLATMAIMMLYTVIVTLVLTKALTLVTEIPNGVMKFIQGGEGLRDHIRSGEQDVQAVKQKVEGGAEKAAQAGGQVASSEAGGISQHGQAGRQIGTEGANYKQWADQKNPDANIKF